MSSQTYLITGANRGLGLGMTGTWAQRPGTTVIAAVRSLDSAKAFDKLEKGKGSRIIPVKLDASNEKDAAAAVEELRKHNITSIDVVVANAGVSEHYAPVKETSVSAVRKHFETNAIGPLVLFQAVEPLLAKSKDAKFVVISSGFGSIDLLKKYPLPYLAYGISKAAANFTVQKIHYEHENITAFPMNPGWVQTDMGNAGATTFGMETAPVTIPDSVKYMVDTIDNATKEKTSGHFLGFGEDGDIPW